MKSCKYLEIAVKSEGSPSRNCSLQMHNPSKIGGIITAFNKSHSGKSATPKLCYWIGEEGNCPHFKDK